MAYTVCAFHTRDELDQMCIEARVERMNVTAVNVDEVDLMPRVQLELYLQAGASKWGFLVNGTCETLGLA